MLPVTTTNPAPSMRTRALTTPSPDTRSTTIKKRTPLRMKTSEPDAKRPTCIPQPQQAMLPGDIGKYVVRDAEAVTRLGWKEFVRWRRGAWRFCFFVRGKAPGVVLVAAVQAPRSVLVAVVQAPRRASRADDDRMVRRRTPGGLEAGTAQVRHQTRPFSPRGICLDSGKWEVGGATLLGGQEATGTQVEPTRSKGGTGKETPLARRL